MKWRYLATFFFFLGAFALIISKLFYWQVVQASQLRDLGQAQYGSAIEVDPHRGEIQTSDGFPLAGSTLSYLVFANPKEVKNLPLTVSSLSDLLNIDKATLSAQLSQNKFWVPLKGSVDGSLKSEIEKYNLPGIGFQGELSRFYPEASMAAQLLGFVGKDANGNDKGYFGLEGFYDRQLKGRPGYATEIHDAFGRPVLTKLTGSTGEEDGRTLVLNIDRTVQFLVEQKLKTGMDKYGASSAEAVVMDPHTGGILAMAGFPGFDPATYWNYDSQTYENPLISDLYEPGSTLKPIVMAGALNAGLVKPETTCPICGGPVQIGDYTIQTWDSKHFPNETMMDILKHSDNDGMIYVSELMGLKRMLKNFHKFGIDSPTNIDLQGEATSTIQDRQNWYPIDVATSSFGQGIAITPIELLDAFSALANNGVRMQPEVVKKILTPQGDTINIDPKVVDTPISSTTAKVMTEMLVYTVDKGEASFARLKGYRIAGKTGTASIPVAGHYDPTKTIASFIGYAPADNPKFAMLVIMHDPTASIYGAETAAPVFFDIAKDLLTYYGVPPTSND